MPALPLPHRGAVFSTAASDTRILDSRQLGQAVTRVTQSLATNARQLLKRIPTLTRRQDQQVCDNFGIIEGCYQGLNAGPTPGAVVGIVLGSIVGFLFILWLLWVLSNGTTFIRTSQLNEEDVIVSNRRRSRSPRTRSHRSSHRHTSHNQQTEMRHSSPRRDRVIRQERIVRDGAPRDVSRVRETVIVDENRTERRVEGDDIVEVIEEHSSVGGAPAPRRKSRRQGGGYR